ncbi:tRNA wybutosine-synthesizing protein 4 [Colletotrichum trifolii]|uniref:tRNA wybutosine-synthesizing protein 4 n=1 Tax=Colletotrichum trifolii TaxID=5466 RepID=A0A4R8Q249_COLTR|nr:tRNA wybutosine-synthesizing protein 4 [Colletotrichum trifolii]
MSSAAGTFNRRAQALDDLVMAERLYYPDETHYFRFFVKKFQRRAPLINRGYHLRLKVIDTLVHHFLNKPSHLSKVVVNLGCGSDVLPWQCHTRYPEACQGVTFVDVDYPDLIAKKRRVVLETPELKDLLGSWEVNDDHPIVLRSRRYCQLACDLRQLCTLKTCLSNLFDLSKTEFLFVAEVSITYMDTEGADGVIKWASCLENAEFCLLEQILPDGPGHPFAQTMLRHFNKLNTPLKSVHRYPTVASQRVRFESLGWAHADSWTLWETWGNDYFMTAAERQALDVIEPFDEWEEFALFASHYVVVLASTSAGSAKLHIPQDLGEIKIATIQAPVAMATYDSSRCYRRFGGAMVVEGFEGQKFVTHSLGQGPNGRLSSEDIYLSPESEPPFADSKSGPLGRVCCTVTDLGNAGVLLVGGRSSPSAAFKDCWLLRKVFNTWERVHDLPSSVYRHSVARLGESSLALLIGGRQNHFRTSPSCFLYNPVKGWTICKAANHPPPLYGAILTCNNTNLGLDAFDGLLLGGICEDGMVSQKVYKWTLNFSDGEPLIDFRLVEVEGDAENASLVCRFGATALQYQGYTIILGGVIKDVQLPGAYDILALEVTPAKVTIVARLEAVMGGADVVRPFMIGSSVATLRDGHIAIVGGGATCFSMGTFWAPGSYSLSLEASQFCVSSRTRQQLAKPIPVRFLKTVEITPRTEPLRTRALSDVATRPVPRIQLGSEEHFRHILDVGEPVIIEDLCIGTCISSWTPEYMTNAVGVDREVTVHESTTEKMDFNSKNFRYVTKKFGDFIKEVEDGNRLYLRALSKDGPSNLPTKLDSDYPSLAQDFCLPPSLGYVDHNLFSSVLRISGPVNMWLHYDVMANIYAQVRGSKRLILFPPADVSGLSVAPGASSSSIDVFSMMKTGSLCGTHPWEAKVSPGDVLFIPPLWLHTAAPTANMSIAVNIFFRSLDKGYSAGRDVYGNRDLAAYEKGRQEVARMVTSFSKLPSDARGFYTRRLADELLQSISNL